MQILQAWAGLSLRVGLYVLSSQTSILLFSRRSKVHLDKVKGIIQEGKYEEREKCT